jgi:hypothetical protein
LDGCQEHSSHHKADGNWHQLEPRERACAERETQRTKKYRKPIRPLNGIGVPSTRSDAIMSVYDRINDRGARYPTDILG